MAVESPRSYPDKVSAARRSSTSVAVVVCTVQIVEAQQDSLCFEYTAPPDIPSFILPTPNIETVLLIHLHIDIADSLLLPPWQGTTDRPSRNLICWRFLLL